MMSRRSSLLKLCKNISFVHCSNQVKASSSQLSRCCYKLPSSTPITWFTTFTRNFESTKIVPDKSGDSNFFGNDDPLDEEFADYPKNPRRHYNPRQTDQDLFSKTRSYRKRWTDEPPSSSAKIRRSKDSEFFYERNNYSDRRGQRSRGWTRDPAPSDFDGSQSVDSFLHEISSEQPLEKRSSMEDLWKQVKDHKVTFDAGDKIEKDFYTEHPDVTNRPQEEIRDFMHAHQMTVSGMKAKRPVFNFKEAGFQDKITEALKLQFDKPTPIQSIGWPHALSGCDIVGIAQTGSGKTLSFVLPAILHVLKRRAEAMGNGPIALVMCPTRELAIQCYGIVEQFRKLCNVRSAIVYGGQSKLVQAKKLIQPGLDMVIATPGRLLDFMSTGTVSMERCSFLVLDEADRMLDMGFEPQIRAVMGQIRPDRQVLMWSATWPEEIQDLASDFLKDYVHIKIGAQTHTVNKDISQEFHYSASYEKTDILLDHLSNNPSSGNRRKPAKTLIFCATKKQCSRLRGILSKRGIWCDIIHGDRSQAQRDEVMYKFRTGRLAVLIASDVASRGIDVTDIEFVINFDMPTNIDSYIHRVGRTGRAGRKGTAISFITADDLEMVKPLIEVLKDAEHEIPDILYELLEKRNTLKSYRKMDRRNQRFPSSWRRTHKFQF